MRDRLIIFVLGILLACAGIALAVEPQTNPNIDTVLRTNPGAALPASVRAMWRTILAVPGLGTENTYTETQWFEDVGVTGSLGIIGSFSVTGVATFSDEVRFGAAAQTRTNLGLGSMAVETATNYAGKSGGNVASTTFSAALDGQSIPHLSATLGAVQFSQFNQWNATGTQNGGAWLKGFQGIASSNTWNVASTASFMSNVGATIGNIAYFGGVLAPNGLIYFAPSNADSVMVVDPVASINFSRSQLLSRYLNKF